MKQYLLKESKTSKGNDDFLKKFQQNIWYFN